MNVYRSGDLYVVARKTPGLRAPSRIVDGEKVGNVKLLGSVTAHVHVAEPWRLVPEPEWPEIVRRVASEDWPDPED